jgi:hypothetical protein
MGNFIVPLHLIGSHHIIYLLMVDSINIRIRSQKNNRPHANAMCTPKESAFIVRGGMAKYILYGFIILDNSPVLIMVLMAKK